LSKTDENMRTFLTVASVELNITHQTTTVELPIEVPHILMPIIEDLREREPALLSHILGLAFLNIMHKKVLPHSDTLNELLKGGDLGGDKA